MTAGTVGDTNILLYSKYKTWHNYLLTDDAEKVEQLLQEASPEHKNKLLNGRFDFQDDEWCDTHTTIVSMDGRLSLSFCTYYHRAVLQAKCFILTLKCFIKPGNYHVF